MEFTEFLKAWKEYKKFENEPDEEVKEEPKEDPKELPKEDPKELPKEDPKENDELTNALKRIEELEKELRKATSRQKLSDRTEDEISKDESLIDELFKNSTIF